MGASLSNNPACHEGHRPVNPLSVFTKLCRKRAGAYEHVKHICAVKKTSLATLISTAHPP